MSEIHKHKVSDPGIRVYLIAVLIGSTLATVLSVLVFSTSTILISAFMGLALAFFGASMGENIGEAIVLSLATGTLCMVAFFNAPEPVANWIGRWVVPSVVGFCSGKITVGIAREL